MPRDRSRSPRRKDRRRSRSRDSRRPDEGEKQLDKFGRDVSARPNDRYGKRGFREEQSSSSTSRRKEEARDYRRESRDDERRHDRYQQPPPPPPPEDNYNGYNEYDSRNDGGPNYFDDGRQKSSEPKVESQEDEVDEETKKMQQLMGLSGFDTTKNKRVSNNVGGYAKINKTQKYRQYMNRRGGFNRPLDYVQ